MTDLEKFIALYKSFGVTCKVFDEKGNKVIRLSNASCNHNENTLSEKFHGWFGHFTDITFTQEGKFIEQGFWE